MFGMIDCLPEVGTLSLDQLRVKPFYNTHIIKTVCITCQEIKINCVSSVKNLLVAVSKPY